MEKVRKPFQGILNIIRFNWHFYVIAAVLIFSILLLSNFTSSTISKVLQIISILISITILISLSVSFYVYDLSDFYNFKWIENDDNKISVININAGFDETSEILKSKFRNSEFLTLDFYNPNKDTEVSIRRARKHYPPYPNTIEIDTSKIDLKSNSIDKAFVILSAHEIRNKEERITFFKELNRILKPKGGIVVIEHLRDISNFMAYNIGSFHFYSKSSWFDTFRKSNLTVQAEIKHTPFISIFIIQQNGNTL